MGQINSTDKNSVIGRIRDYSHKALGGDLVFSAIFGSYAYNSWSKNDIDMIFVTREPLSRNKRSLMEQGYFEIHAKYGLVPDLRFPGEYVALKDLKKAEKGEGFIYSRQVEIMLLSCGDDWNDFNDYRHHLTAVGGPTIFIGGSIPDFYSHKKICLQTLIGVLLLSKQRSSFLLEEIVEWMIENGKDFLGFENTPNVRSYLQSNLNELLHQLSFSGKLVLDKRGAFSFKGNFLNQLEQSIRRYNEK